MNRRKRHLYRMPFSPVLRSVNKSCGGKTMGSLRKIDLEVQVCLWYNNELNESTNISFMEEIE